MKKFSKLLSMALAIIMVVSLLAGIPVFAAEEAPTVSDPDGLLYTIQTQEKREYIADMIDYYINANSKLVDAMDNGNKTVAFMFEGGSDSTVPYTEYSAVRDQAVSIVVYEWEIICVSQNSSTIPDHPHKAYYVEPSSATIKDGLYTLKTICPGDKVSNFRVLDMDGINNIPCIRMNTAKGKYVTMPYASDILIHSRDNNISGSKSCTSPHSTGCLTVATKTSSDWKNFQAAVRTAYSVTKSAQAGYLIVDRQLAVEALADLYEYEGTIENMTAFSTAAREACYGDEDPEDTPDPEDSELEISLDDIGTIEESKSCDILGYVSSNYTLKVIKGEILSGNTVLQSARDTSQVTYKNIAASNVNRSLLFGKLEAGSYTLRITATDASGKTVSESVDFTVKGLEEISDIDLTLQEIGTVSRNVSVNIVGKVESYRKLVSVKGEILTGETVVKSAEDYPNAKTYDLSSGTINTQLNPGAMGVGEYTLRITATDDLGGTAVKSVAFRTVTTASGSELNGAVNAVNTVNKLVGYTLGGYFQSNNFITKVTVDIVSGSTNLQSAVVYPNAIRYELSDAELNAQLDFTALNAGTYALRVIATDESGRSVERTQYFTVSVPASSLTASAGNLGTVDPDKGAALTGKASSNYFITEVRAEVLLGTAVKLSAAVAPNATTFDFASGDLLGGLDFSALAAGTYTLKITVTDSTGKTVTLNQNFTVKPAFTESSLQVSIDEIGTIMKGSSHTITGVVSSNALLKTVTSKVLKGTTVMQTTTDTVSTDYYELRGSKIDNNTKFGSLAVGQYTLSITAVDSTGKSVTETVDFTVKGTVASSTLTGSLNAISTINMYSSYTLGGSVRSNYKILSVTGEILCNGEVLQSGTITPNATNQYLNTKDFNALFHFEELKAGSYTFQVTAVDETDKTVTFSRTFTVKAPASTLAATLNTISAFTSGASRDITGKVTSNYPITSLKAEVLCNGSVVGSAEDAPMEKTVSLADSAVNDSAMLKALAKGSYSLRLTAVDESGKSVVKTVSFTVNAAAAPSAITINVTPFSKVSYGCSKNIVGTITSTYAITNVKGEILQNGTAKQTVSSSTNSKSINIAGSVINSRLRFAVLAKGSYVLRITATDSKGLTEVFEMPFTVA